MRELKEGVDFEYLIPKESGTTVPLKILTGKYSGTTFQYGKVSFDEQSDGAIFLRFVYNIVESALEKQKLEKDPEFKNFIGDILVNIMSQNLDQGIVDETGNDYIEESDL